MTVLKPFNPFRDFDELINHYPGFYLNKHQTPDSDWSPLADITETDDAFMVKAELAGVKKEDIKLSIEHGILTLKGERKSKYEDEKKHHIERFYGTFVRQFTLPQEIDEQAISAEFHDGVLDLIIPKKPRPTDTIKQIDIH